MSQLLLQLPEHELVDIENASGFTDAARMRQVAPALFATTAHPKMTDRYSFTNTYDILTHMHNRGFKVSSVQGGESLYKKVMVRLRPTAFANTDYAPELVLLDSHDGSSRLKMFLGFIRFVCMNGCIAGDMLYARSFVHLAPDLMEQVMLELDDVGEHIGSLIQRIDRMKQHETTLAERLVLADVAVKQRFGEDRSGSFVADMRQRMLQIRRNADNDNSLYCVMNVIQENIMRGGMTYQSNNTVRRMSSIRNVDRSVNINQALWQQADELITRRAA